MRAVRCHEWMRYQDLPLEEVPSPISGDGQVRIDVHYAGVSFATSLVTMGRYQRRPPCPFSPGTEVAGVVGKIAPGVTQVAVGDRVCAVIDWGGHAEEVVIDPATVYRLPDALPFHLAPQFPTSYATAFAALDWRAQLQPGETLLVHGSAGAVGLAAVELGKAMGARVIATASTPEKLTVVRAHGADATLLLPSEGALDGDQGRRAGRGGRGFRSGRRRRVRPVAAGGVAGRADPGDRLRCRTHPADPCKHPAGEERVGSRL